MFLGARGGACWERAKKAGACWGLAGPVQGCSGHKEPLECPDVVVQNALYTGDLEEVQRHFSERAEVNLIILAKSHDLRWTSQKWGLWSLTYEQELTTPLHITASRGFVDCLRHLLLRGADVDLAPGGQTALHVACTAARTDCARLLLSFGADPEAVSEDGLRPLHLCQSPESLQCAQLLLCHGATVNSATEEEEDTPLHRAARLGLAEHVRLFLSYGASPEARNAEGQTPLNAACAQSHPPQAIEDYFKVCQQLVAVGAQVNTADHDRQRPLHQACKNANPRVVQLLLAHGADVNIMSYSGNMAIHNILQVAAYKTDRQPEQVVRDLLNHGAVRIWPGALLKVWLTEGEPLKGHPAGGGGGRGWCMAESVPTSPSSLFLEAATLLLHCGPSGLASLGFMSISLPACIPGLHEQGEQQRPSSAQGLLPCGESGNPIRVPPPSRWGMAAVLQTTEMSSPGVNGNSEKRLCGIHHRVVERSPFPKRCSPQALPPNLQDFPKPELATPSVCSQPC